MVTRLMAIIIYANVKLLISTQHNIVCQLYFNLKKERNVCTLVVANMHQLINIHHEEKIMIIHHFLFNLKTAVLNSDYCLEYK